MESKQQIDVGSAVRMLLACKPSVIDEDAIRETFGNTKVDSAAAVSRVFGVSYVTIKTSWRPSGMPAGAKLYRIADILIWQLKRIAKTPSSATAGVGDRKTDAEIRKVEAEAQLKELAVEKKEGEYISVIWAKSVIAAKLGIIRDGIMGIGRKVMPQLPKKQAVEIRESIDRQCEVVLNAVADDLLEEIDQRKEEQNDVNSAD